MTENPLFVPGELDFFHAEVEYGLPPDALLPQLKWRMLFFGQILLPMEFLLFNKGLYAMWRSGGARRDRLTQFARGARVVLSRANKPALREFVSRYERALDSNNPCVIPDHRVPDAAEFTDALPRSARYLESAFGGAAHVEYDVVTKLNNYEELFHSELRRLDRRGALPPEFSASLIAEATTLTREHAPEASIVDETDALKRAAITRVLRYSSHPLLRRFRNVIWQCAHLMYMRNVSSDFTHRWQEGQPIITSGHQLDRAVVLQLNGDDGFLDELVRQTDTHPFCVDWSAIRQAPWEEIAEFIHTSPAAQDYFEARKHMIDRESVESLQLFAGATTRYLAELEERFRPDRPVRTTSLGLAHVGGIVTVSVIEHQAMTGATPLQMPIVCALLKHLLHSVRNRRKAAAQRRTHDERRARITNIALRQYYPEDHVTPRSGDDASA